jgi:hypothetical protein
MSRRMLARGLAQDGIDGDHFAIHSSSLVLAFGPTLAQPSTMPSFTM